MPPARTAADPPPDDPSQAARRAALGLGAFIAVVLGLAWAFGELRIDATGLRQALLGGGLAAAATAIGAWSITLDRTPSARTQAGMLGFAAGVMLAATSFSLLMPGIEAARGRGWADSSSAMVVAAGLLAGAVGLMALERRMPHAHPFIGPYEDSPQARRLLRFVLAIVLHNVPEGLAIGVASVVDPAAVTTGVATGIAIQNLPEGMVVALALRAAGIPIGRAIAVSAITGLVEPTAAVIGAVVVGWSALLLPWGLAAAAGAMLFVVSHEIIPESHRQGHEHVATGGLLAGFAMMIVLDGAFG